MGKVKSLQLSTGTSAGTVTSIDGTATAKSADYTVLDTDLIRTILMTTGASNRTVTLPTAADNTNRILTVTKVDSGAGTCIIDGEGAETINGATTLTLTTQYDTATLQCDGTGWYLIDRSAIATSSIAGLVNPYVTSSGVVYAGTYTPTLYGSGSNNIAAYTTGVCNYLRVGSMVTVSGYIFVDAAATSTATSMGVSLPVASNIGAVTDCVGVISGGQVGLYFSGIVSGDATNDRATFDWYHGGDAANRQLSFHFTYRII